MTSLRTLARPLLASVFIVDGWDAVRHPEKHVEKLGAAAKPLTTLAAKVPGVPQDETGLARLSGAVSVGAGVLLATGKFPRLSAAVLALIATPTTVLNKPSAKNEDERREQKRVRLRNAALIGAMIIAAGDREGEPSGSWKRAAAKEHRAELAELKANLRAEKSELKSDLRAKVKEAKAA